MWVSADIAKDKRERMVLVIPDLELVVEEIRATVPVGEYVPRARVQGSAVHRASRRRRPQGPPSRNYAQLATCSLVAPVFGDPQAAQTTLPFEPSTPSDFGVAVEKILPARLLALTACPAACSAEPTLE